MDDGRSDLALDIVADERKPALRETALPYRVRGDENGDTIDKGAARIERLLGIPFRCLLRADRQIGNQDVGLRSGQRRGDVRLFLVR